ncbi:MAG: hypothetical protein KBG47_02165 [Bacteroidia bacterium]|nr:hypothetical protein [Sphingobacteriaceae bacterium]MBP9068283.1 hypothetical protein [Bacteroidia bacterium]
MKKSLTLLALALGISTSFAQELKSKKEEMILPEAGDWGLAIDANPFLQYAGNFFGKTTTNAAPTFNFFTNANTITGRYFTDAQTCYRGSLRIGLGGASERNMVADVLKMNAAATSTATGWPAASAMVENVWKQSNTTVGLAAGMEMRKGKTRLQGYYGGEVGIYMNMMKDKFTYGNALVSTTTASLNVDVTAADEFTGANAYGNVGNNLGNPAMPGLTAAGARVTERKYGTTFSFGLRGFIGAEYFILAKMSIGGEFGWGLGLSSQGATKTSWEGVGSNGAGTFSTGSAEIETSKGGGQWWLDTDGVNSVWGPTGTLRLNLYF